MLEFNTSGLLVPPTIIKSTIDEMEEYFAIDSPGNIRRSLFASYQEYNKRLKEICGDIELKQWIDGSFVTKKARPGDIDIVNIINFETAEVNEFALREFTYPASLTNYGLDAYLLVVYPEDDKRYFGYRANRSYWINQFDKTKSKDGEKGMAKGFLEIII